MTVNSNEKGMHLPHGLTCLCELSFFFHTVFIFVKSESCHIYTTSLLTFQHISLQLFQRNSQHQARYGFGYHQSQLIRPLRRRSPVGRSGYDYIFQLSFSLGDENHNQMRKRIVTFQRKNSYQDLGKLAVFSFDCASQCDRK